MQNSLFRMTWICVALGLAGCSVSIPLPSLLSEDDDATASIDRARAQPAPVTAPGDRQVPAKTGGADDALPLPPRRPQGA